MHIPRARTLLIGLGIVSVIGALVYMSDVSARFVYALQGRLSTDPASFTVAITNEGFVPKELTIMRGDTVIFHNERTTASRPASDPHPTHDSDPLFDVVDGIQPGASWSHRFDREGNWRYHDHLDVSLQGEISVRGSSPWNVQQSAPCEGDCFDELIRTTVVNEGIDAAYRLFQASYDAGSLPRSCHWTAHKIGEAAYELFREGHDFPISDATTYCGYGFYHGFLEGLLRENPDPEYALSLCAKVEEKLGTMGLWNCYHGIGHGFTEDPPSPETEGNFNAMIEPGIAMCEFLFGGNFRDLNLCLTGVYTVPAGFAGKGEHGLSIAKDSVFKYCADQPYRYLKACYGEFAPKLDAILQWNVRNLTPIVQSISDEKLQRLVTWVVPSVMVAHDIQSSDFSAYINGCRTAFAGPLRRICWGGTILGFFTHGEPERQYELVFRMCNANAWETEEERRFCWGEGLRQMRTNYSIAKVESLCLGVPEAYRELCLDAGHKHASPYDDPSFD